jgi:hypothetical protein
VNVFFSPFADKEIGKNLEIFPTENLTNFAKFLLKFAKILKSKHLGKYVSTYTCYLSLFTRAKVKCELFPVLTHLSTKEGSLFVLFCVSRWDPQTRMLQIVFLISLESSGRWGFHGVWTCSAKVLEYWIIFSLKMKWNHSWKFQRNWIVPLMFLERSWWAGFNGIYLVRFGFRMWEILIF